MTPEARVGRTVSAAWVLAVGVVFAGPLLYLALLFVVVAVDAAL